MKRLFTGLLALCMAVMLVTPVYAALPSGTGVIKSSGAVSGSEFSSKSSIAKKLNKMFAGEIGLYKDFNKTKPVDAALGTRSVPNNGVMQYWGPDPGGGGTSCFAYANAFYGYFYDGVYPHRTLNGNHKKVKATGKISYANFVKWGVRDDAAVYIREGNHSIVVLHYDENYITYVDGNGDGKGGVALRKEAWRAGPGSNIYNQKPSLIVQPTKAYFAAGSMGKKQAKSCAQGGTSHDWDGGKIAKAATCKDTGIKIFTCLDCGKTKEETVAKTADHSYGDWTVTEEATCTEAGTKTSMCTVCQKKQTKTVKKLGHSYGKAVEVQTPTIYSAGVTEKTCKRCGEVKTIKSSCTYENEELGITLTAKVKVFPKKTQASATAPEEYPEGYEEMLQCSRFRLYQLAASVKETPVQPKGTVTLELELPEDFGGNLALYQITDDTLEELEGTLENNLFTAQLESFGMFALCDLDVPYVPETQPTEPETEPATEPETEPATEPVAVAATALTAPKIDVRTQRYFMMIGVLAAIFLAALVALILVVKNRRKKKKPVSTTEEAVSAETPAETRETEEAAP